MPRPANAPTPIRLNEQDLEPLAVRIPTAARLLDCSVAHIYNLIAAGRLTRVHLAGRAARIPMSEIRRMAEGK
jgi:excisionase family DNA binding protein